MPTLKRNGWHRRPNTAAETERARQYASREHRQQRVIEQRRVDAGHAYCWRCGHHLPPGCTWHLGHDDHDRTRYRGAECPPCNIKAAARKGAAMVNRRTRRTAILQARHAHSRDW